MCANNGIPVLLLINEAPLNPHCDISLTSEHQVRENGFVCDSVAWKHKKGPGTWGTQRLELNEFIHIPFVDRGGIMGFEMLPIEEGDIDKLNPKLDIFELTSPHKWLPAQFRAANATLKEPIDPGGPPDVTEHPLCPTPPVMEDIVSPLGIITL